MKEPSAARRPELEELLGGYSIGGAINALRAWPIAIRVIKEIAGVPVGTPQSGTLGYMDGLPEEITAEIKAVLDIAEGGDGVIYR
jgi:hypothetical protein